MSGDQERPRRPKIYFATERDVPQPGTVSMVLKHVSVDLRGASYARADSSLGREAQLTAAESTRKLVWQEVALIAVISGKQNEILDAAGTEEAEVPIQENFLTARVRPISVYLPEAEHMDIEEAIRRLDEHVAGRNNMTIETRAYARDLREKMQREAMGEFELDFAPPIKDNPQVVFESGATEPQPARRRKFSLPKLRRRPKDN